jgi:hypothetical protein
MKFVVEQAALNKKDKRDQNWQNRRTFGLFVRSLLRSGHFYLTRFVVEQVALNKKDKGGKKSKIGRLLGFLFPLLSFLLKPNFLFIRQIFLKVS